MSERKLTRGLDDIAPNNSDKVARSKERVIEPNDTKVSTKRKKLTPIVKGATIKQKPNFFEKFKTSFLGEGGNVGEFVVYDILVPALRNTISDMGFGIIEMFFGTSRDRGRSSRNDNRIVRDRGRSYINYQSPSSDRGRNNRDYRDMDQGDRARHEFGNVIFESRGEAEDVLSRLVDLVEEYGEAPVAAFYELSRIESEHTDGNWGWTNLRDAYTDRVRNGYIIRFPQTRPL